MTNRFYYDFEDPKGHKIMDLEKSKYYPLETIGDFQAIESLLNQYEKEELQLLSLIGDIKVLAEEKNHKKILDLINQLDDDVMDYV